MIAPGIRRKFGSLGFREVRVSKFGGRPIQTDFADSSKLRHYAAKLEMLAL